MSLPQKQTYTESDYYTLPEDIRAELIDGQIYYQTAPNRIHQKLLMILTKTISNYIDNKNGSCEVYPAPFAVKLCQDKTIVKPDISVRCDPDKLTDRGCTGAPDWIIEIVSPSSRQMAYYKKLALYQEAGVREYWIVDPPGEVVMVYDLANKMPPAIYYFTDSVKVNIYSDLQIDFGEIKL